MQTRFQQTAARLGALGTMAVALIVGGLAAQAQEPPQSRANLKEPVYRISKAKVDGNARQPAHPLDPAIAIASDGLRNIRENVRDYNCVLVKRERIGGELGEYQYIYTKVRSEQLNNGRVVVPFSVYMYFLKPSEMKGREVIFVKGQNNGKLVAHERRDSLKGKFGSVWLPPEGALAMMGNRYPITEVGLKTLVVRLLEKGNRDRKRGECQVEFRKGAKINGRQCTMLQVTHPVQRPYFDFHVARIFIDDELNVPLRYAAYSWPKTPGGAPVLDEEYTYLKLNLNVGLTDKDFDVENKEYSF